MANEANGRERSTIMLIYIIGAITGKGKPPFQEVMQLLAVAAQVPTAETSNRIMQKRC